MAIKVDRTTKYVQTFTEKLGADVELTMVLIPDGKFLMGSLAEEEGHLSRESPQHEVTIPEPFFMGPHPITQAQWRRVALLPQIKRKLEPEPSSFKDEDDDLPVNTVSWLNAQEFCGRLSRYTKHSYRLPSEAEWEYACRAGTTTPFHFGETIDAQLANYEAQDWEYEGKIYPGKYGEGELGENRKQTTPVGSLGAANDFGLSDMHGNVWEWCEDDWHDSYENAPTDGSAWLDSKNKNNEKVLRGGSWSRNPHYCRSAYRNRYNTDDQDFNIGFRVVYAPARTL